MDSTPISQWRPSSVTAEDHNDAAVKLIQRDADLWRPSSVTAEDRNNSGSTRHGSALAVAAVLRDGRGSQRLAPQQLVPRVAAWRPSSVTAEDRNWPCIAWEQLAEQWRPSSVTAEDRNTVTDVSPPTGSHVAAVLRDGRGSQPGRWAGERVGRVRRGGRPLGWLKKAERRGSRLQF